MFSVLHEVADPLFRSVVDKVVDINDSDTEFSGAVSQGNASLFSGHDRRTCNSPSEPVPQDRQFIQRFGPGVTGFAADKQRGDAAGAHNVKFIGNGIAAAAAIPVDNGTGDHVLKQTGVQTGFVDIEFQHAPDIPQPGTHLRITKVKGNGFFGNDGKIMDKTKVLELTESIFGGADPGRLLPFTVYFPDTESGMDPSAFPAEMRCMYVTIFTH